MASLPRLDNNLLRTLLDKKALQIPQSTCVATFDYDLESETLIVQFQARGTYKYENFPLDEFVTFSQAGSLGTYFNLYIRDQYPYERIA